MTRRRGVLVALVAVAASSLPKLPAAADASRPGVVRQALASDHESAVLDAGSTPRKRLLLDVPVGAVQHIEMTQRSSVSTSGEAPQRSESSAKLTQTVTDIDGDGNLHVTAAVDDLTVTGADAEAIRNVAEQVRGTTAQLVVSPRNEIVSSNVDLAGVADPLVSQVLTQFTSQLRQLSQPFPVRPVGVGARWRTSTTLTIYGVDVELDTTYTLRARKGTRLELGYRTLQRSTRQRAELPGAPAAANVTARVDGRGRGTQTTDLALPLPVVASTTGRGRVSFQAELGGNVWPVALVLRQEFEQQSTG